MSIRKIDHGKPDLSIIMDAPISMSGLSRCLEMGANKDNRTRDSWKEYNDPDGLIAALLRHLMAWTNGEEADPDTGLNHLVHVVTNAVMLCETNPSDKLGERSK